MEQEKSPLAMDAIAAAKLGLSYGKYKAIQYDQWREAEAVRKAERAAAWEIEKSRRIKEREKRNG